MKVNQDTDARIMHSKGMNAFYRVDKSRSKHTGGYGLGLNLCKTIMDAHKGRIEVGSAPGQGTRVSLFFNMP